MNPRPLHLAVALIVAVLLSVVAAEVLMDAPRSDVLQLALFLSLSGAGSLGLGAILVRWGAGRLGSLHWRLALAYGVGLLVVVVNVVATSVMMFLSSHDLALLLLLLAFGAAISVAFGYVVVSALSADLAALARAAGRLAAGDLDARVNARGSDEVARLAAAFDQMAAQLQQAFERQRELEASRRELVAAVSHDLRTPLATTRAMVEAIMDGVVSEPAEVRRYLELIQREVQHLSRLIDDLFELSQIESGALALQLAPTLLPELVAQTLEAYQAQARDGGVAIEHTAPPDLPAVEADAARLQRVLRNLIDNALHHTPSGGQVRVVAVAQSGEARVSVIDTGPGLAPDEMERVFDRFYRGERARSRADGVGRLPGAGLGLAIARGLVQAHGGRIWAEPSPSGGATFAFTLPLARSRA